MKFKSLLFLIYSLSTYPIQAENSNTDRKNKLEKRITLHGMIKPQKMSTLVSIGEGIVSKVIGQLGQKVGPNQNLLQVFEKESVRNYRNTIQGKIAKIHVTEGAAISPGMPLVTVVNDENLYMELSLSPQTANELKLGMRIFQEDRPSEIGKIVHIAPIVDPDNGSVKAITGRIPATDYRIGQVLAVQISLGEQDCDIVENIGNINEYTNGHEIKFLSKNKVCIDKKKK
jgi:hypothetical protein